MIRKTSIFFAIIVLLAISGCIGTQRQAADENSIISDDANPQAGTGAYAPEKPKGEAIEEYDPVIDPSDFSSDVTNMHFNLIPRKKMIYEGETEDGLERIEYYVTDETRTVMGIRARVVWDRVWLDGELVEDTKDWFAQDREGNVWYFGEDSAEILEGKIINHDGSWEAGIDGAKPGIVMMADPEIGDEYRQEYYMGEAEDMARIESLSEEVDTPLGRFSGCLMTFDYTPLEPDLLENKYYCPGAGGVAMETDADGGEKIVLISIEYDADPTPADAEGATGMANRSSGYGISEDEAKEIALENVPGMVTDIGIEKKSGRLAYVVEVDAEDGPETDVVIDMETGEVLDIDA